MRYAKGKFRSNWQRKSPRPHRVRHKGFDVYTPTHHNALQKLILLAFFLATVLFARTAVAQDGKMALMLGMNYPLTGPYSVEGLDQIRAARLAVDEINSQGGILGYRVKLLAVDSASSVIQTRINVEELVREGCSMIFGGASSAVAIAAADVCQHYDTLFFGTLTYSTETTIKGAHRILFRECNDSGMSAIVMSDWLNERFKGKKYYYITSDYTWGWTTEESLREVTGTKDRTKHPSILVPFGSSDMSEALDQAALFQPDVLVLSLFGKDMSYALKQAHAMGLKNHTQIVVPNLTLGMAERAGAEAMERVVGTLPWTWKIPYLFGYERGKAFVDEFVRRYNRYPGTSAASAYTIVHEYKSAVERSGSLETSDIIKALEGHSYTLLKGLQTWRPLDHQSIQTVYMVIGNNPNKVLADKLRLDHFDVIHSMPGDKTVLPESEWKKRRVEAGLPPKLEELRR